MDGTELEGRRPRNDGAAELFAALETLAAQHRDAGRRREAARARRAIALRNVSTTAADIVAIESEENHARADEDRLVALQADLSSRLQEARRRESLQQRRIDVETSRAALAEAATALQKALPGYLKAAAKIVEIADLGTAQTAALAAFRRAVQELRAETNEQISSDAGFAMADTIFLTHAVLPNMQVNGKPLLGVVPHVVPAHYYQNRP
jgi:hypothetical protein